MGSFVRKMKAGETVMIGGGIASIEIVEVEAGRARIAVRTPSDVAISYGDTSRKSCDNLPSAISPLRPTDEMW